MPGEEPPSSKFYNHKNGDWCNENMECKCYRPKCAQHKTCAKLGGECIMKGMPVPEGATSVLVKGKPFFCNKKLKCQCFKITIMGK